MTITAGDFDFIRVLVRDRSAIVLETGKEYLAEARLEPLARKSGLGTIEALVARLRAEPFNGLHTKVVEALTTNETSFFRDVQPFEALREEILPRLIAARSDVRSLDVWCAAASTGQEPYSLAILLREHFPELEGWRVRIVATDINREVLARAQAGRFSALEVNRGLPASLLVRHFKRQGADWELDARIRSMVEFRELNLAASWPMLGPLDLVMMRNVLIYFDVDTKRDILARTHRALRPDGALLLGSAETTLNLTNDYTLAQAARTIYYRPV